MVLKISSLEKPVSLWGWLSAEAILAALSISGVVFFMGQGAGVILVFLYLLANIMRKKARLGWFVTFTIFMCIGLFAAYRYEIKASMHWILFIMLPIVAEYVLVHIPVIQFRWFTGIGRFVSQKFIKHWVVGSLLVGELVALVFRGVYSVYGGTLVLLLIVNLLIANLTKRQTIGLCLAIFSYVVMLHLFTWRGILLLSTEPLEFLRTYGSTIVTPFLMVIIVYQKRRVNET